MNVREELSKPLHEVDNLTWEVVDDVEHLQATKSDPEVIEDDSFIYGWSHNDKEIREKKSQDIEMPDKVQSRTCEIELADVGLETQWRNLQEENSEQDHEGTPESSIPFLAGALLHRRALNLEAVPIESCDKSDGQTTIQVALNLMNCIVGAGVLSLPFALRQGGSAMSLVVPGLSVVMTMTMWMIGHTMGALDDVAARAGIPCKSRNWTMLGTMVFGRVGRILVPLLFVSDLFPTVVAYMIFAGDNTHMLAPTSDLSTHMFVLSFVAFLLLFVPLKYFSIFSAMGIIAQVLSLLALVVTAVELKVGQHEQSSLEAGFFKVDGFLGASGIVIFLFSAHSAVPQFYQSMQNREDWPRACFLGGSGASLFYVIVGSLGYWTFGDATLQVFSLNLGRDRHLNVLEGPLPEAFNQALGPVVGFFISFKLLVTFPVYTRPVLDCIEEAFGAHNSACGGFIVKVGYSLAVAFLSAYFKEYAAFVVEVIGCVVHSSMLVLLPCAFYLRVCRPSCPFKVLIWVIAICFAVYTPIGLVQIVYHVLRPCCKCGECEVF
mmetsp:Transcript_146603/g.258327  ORF Transcript_146603/g.258327 Transcript_146603/m.258327 type:complete len:548 (+) Transcript_146603:36-1679(+)